MSTKNNNLSLCEEVNVKSSPSLFGALERVKEQIEKELL